MPAQWPNNSVNKLARAVNGSFKSAFAIAVQPNPTPLPTGDIVVEDFEAGNLANASSTEFEWAQQIATSIVTQTEAGNPAVVYTATGDETFNELVGDSRDWTAFSGNNSLRFRYDSGGSQAWSEQRFNILASNVYEIYISFWLRVPTNFYLRDNTPNNNKLLRFWHGDYTNTMGMEFRPTGNGDSYFYINPGSGTDGTATFATVADQGRWMNLVYQGRYASSDGATDGVQRCWRKWEDEAVHTLLLERLNDDMYDLGGFTEGYLLGYSNTGYDTDTEFLIDNVVISTEAII